jgi:thiol-disulfide isomerase/thioredoxin|uniref:Thioredoxin domain-containing protein n=1 Tax=viral metagenome TaxID=1070528 RepID=A0A6C0DWJ8_9ZZZZ
MANLLVYVNTLMKPYYKYIVFAFFVIVFILVSKYAYEQYYVRPKKVEKVKNVANASSILPIMAVYFFHVEWCPHCVSAKPEWDAFQEQYHNTELNGYLIQCHDIDCTDDNGEEVIQVNPKTNENTDISPTPIRISELIKKFKVDSYPTIKLTKDDLMVDFEAKVTKDNLTQFVNSV